MMLAKLGSSRGPRLQLEAVAVGDPGEFVADPKQRHRTRTVPDQAGAARGVQIRGLHQPDSPLRADRKRKRCDVGNRIFAAWKISAFGETHVEDVTSHAQDETSETDRST
jgi:hypothetical protein